MNDNFDDNDKYIWYPITNISLIEESVREMFATSESDYKTLSRLINNVVTINENQLCNIAMFCAEQKKFVKHYVKQIKIWKSSIDAAEFNQYQQRIDKLSRYLKTLGDLYDEMLTMVDQLSHVKISKFLEMMDNKEMQSVIQSLINEINKDDEGKHTLH